MTLEEDIHASMRRVRPQLERLGLATDTSPRILVPEALAAHPPDFYAFIHSPGIDMDRTFRAFLAPILARREAERFGIVPSSEALEELADVLPAYQQHRMGKDLRAQRIAEANEIYRRDPRIVQHDIIYHPSIQELVAKGEGVFDAANAHELYHFIEWRKGLLDWPLAEGAAGAVQDSLLTRRTGRSLSDGAAGKVARACEGYLKHPYSPADMERLHYALQYRGGLLAIKDALAAPGASRGYWQLLEQGFRERALRGYATLIRDSLRNAESAVGPAPTSILTDLLCERHSAQEASRESVLRAIDKSGMPALADDARIQDVSGLVDVLNSGRTV